MMRLTDMGFKPAAVALTVFLTACGMPDPAPPSTTLVPPPSTEPAIDAAAELEIAMQRWADFGPETYNFHLIDDCGECDPGSREPQRVVVWSGEAIAHSQPTIHSLFAQIDAAIGEGREVEVTYDSALGYPTEIGIDMQDRAFDGGHHLLVEALAPGLPGEQVAIDRLEAARALWDANRPRAYEFTTSIHCECDIAGTIWARVEEERIVDWALEFSDEPGTQISPITVDMMFDDLADMFSLVDGVVEEGVRFTGSAEYDPILGYPAWVGLDIEILDPTSELASLPPRLVFSIDTFDPLDDSANSADYMEKARERWAMNGPSDYQYELRVHDIANASFTAAYVVTVSGGAVISVESNGRPVDDPPAQAASIDGVFDLIANWLAAGGTIEALYDSYLGLPVLVVLHEPEIPSKPVAFTIQNLTESS